MAKTILFLLCLTIFSPPAMADARFRDNHDGTVTDTATGYMWQKRPPENSYTWYGARDYAGRLTLAGYCDWRVPDKDALLRLYDAGHYWDDFFWGSWYRTYWSSTTIAPGNSKNYAWAVEFEYGTEVSGDKSTDRYYVRAVRDVSGDCYCSDKCDDGKVYVHCFINTLFNRPDNRPDN